MSMLGFQTLHCPKCDKTKVTVAYELVWQEGKGQAQRQVGYVCHFCSLPFDSEGAIKKIKQKELQEKIKELEVSGR